MMAEDAAARIKRMRMRAWRRGIKEMDLILGPYADERLAAMPPDDAGNLRRAAVRE
jgi:antitoxin CptB